ncbi:MAG: thioredoxin family protein [Cyclobacteriaceae bacterium]|nr:thioredoxin family protein [Cyclobacteriaceae bacterium]
MKSINLLLIAIISFAMLSLTGRSAEPDVGQKASDFNLKNVDGKMISLSDFKGAPAYVVIFTCNSCPYAKDWEDRIIDLHAKYASRGIPVLAINPNDPSISGDDSFEKMVEISKKQNYTFPYLFDQQQTAARAYGATRTPHAYVLDKNMVIRYIGAIDNNHKNAKAADKKYVEEAVEAILQNKEVKTKSTKAIGCTIKWTKS